MDRFSIYRYTVNLHNILLHMNLNPHNIVDEMTHKEVNTFLNIYCQTLSLLMNSEYKTYNALTNSMTVHVHLGQFTDVYAQNKTINKHVKQCISLSSSYYSIDDCSLPILGTYSLPLYHPFNYMHINRGESEANKEHDKLEREILTASSIDVGVDYLAHPQYNEVYLFRMSIRS